MGLKQLLQKQDGATVIEYALIAALIALVVVVSLQSMSPRLNNTYTRIGTSIAEAS